jgi:hypothetical protein
MAGKFEERFARGKKKPKSPSEIGGKMGVRIPYYIEMGVKPPLFTNH